uniref:Transposase (putative) gypsy type domain-containing protein n=1 Tax=Tanacetum cinerariifolium TaxID=118510 RepID=A0A6L2LIX6_TANCI|nr:hypothetical protein [Tanacetum cinerariifolium]
MAEEDPPSEVTVVPKFDMPYHVSAMSHKDVKSLAKQYDIPSDLQPCAPTEGWTMDKLLKEVIGLYEQFLKFLGVRVPFSTLLLETIKHFRVHITQLVPLGLNRLIMFELYCRNLSIIPTASLFRVFYKISKQGHRFSFERRVGKGAGAKIFRETLSGIKGWKDRFLFLDRRAIPDAMAWRHHDSNVNDALPDDGFSILDVRALDEKFIDFVRYPPVFSLKMVLLVPGIFLAFILFSKIPKGMNPIDQHITPPLLEGHPILDKTDFQKEVEVEDPKFLVARKRKA